MKLKKILEVLNREGRKVLLLEQRYDLNSFWITPDREFIDIDTHHFNWVLFHNKRLKDDYGIDVLSILDIGDDEAMEYGMGEYEDIPRYVSSKIDEEIYPVLFDKGWVRGGYLRDGVGEIVFQLGSKNNLKSIMLNKMLEVINNVFNDVDPYLEISLEFHNNMDYYNFVYEDFLKIESKRDLEKYDKTLI